MSHAPLTPEQEDYRQKLLALGTPPDSAWDVAARTVFDNPPKPSAAAPSRAGRKPRAAAGAAAKRPPTPRKRAPLTALVQPVAATAIVNARTSVDLAKIEQKTGQLSLYDLLDTKWGEDFRVLPNEIARTAIFSARNRKTPREYFKNKPLFSLQKNVRVHATGLELRAVDDEKVFNELLELGKQMPAGEPFEFQLGAFCRALGWRLNEDYYQKLIESLVRLQTFSLQLETPRLGGALLSLTLAGKLLITDRNLSSLSTCVISLPKEILHLFAGQQYLAQDRHSLLSLSPATRRLYDYVASHKVPHPLHMRDFQEVAFLSGYASSGRLRQLCRSMCAELLELNLVVAAWLDENDCIRIVRHQK